MKDFYYDYYSLKNINLDDWSENFKWPVSFLETQEIIKCYIEIFKKIIKENKYNQFTDLLYIYNHTWNPYILFTNYLLLNKRLKKKNLIFSEKSKFFNYIKFKKTFPIEIENFEWSKENLRVRKFKDKVKSFFFNLKLPQKSLLNSSNQAYCINDSNLLEMKYLRENKEYIKILSPDLILTGYKKIKISDLERNQIYEFVGFIDTICKKKMLEIIKDKVPGFIFNDIKDYQREYFLKIYKILKALEKNTEIKKINKIYVSAPKTFVKALSIFLKSRSIEIVGVPHGYFFCHSDSYRHHITEFLSVTSFLVYKKSHIKRFKEIQKKIPPLNKSDIKFVSQETDKFEQFERKFLYRIPKKIRSVMLVELQLWCDDIRLEIPETMIVYNFYYNLCKVLSEKNYKIFFKKRPKSWGWDNINIFNKFKSFEVVEGDLTDPKIMGLADTIIFQYGLSSTFIPLISSNKNLVYTDCGWERWNPEIYRLLQKRCSILKCWFNKKNKMCFNKDKLITILESKPSIPDKTLFRKYLSA